MPRLVWQRTVSVVPALVLRPTPLNQAASFPKGPSETIFSPWRPPKPWKLPERKTPRFSRRRITA